MFQIYQIIMELWRVIRDFPIEDSDSSWSAFPDEAERVVSNVDDPAVRDLIADWFLSYSKFRDIQLTNSDPNDYVLPDYLKIGAERFLQNPS